MQKARKLQGRDEKLEKVKEDRKCFERVRCRRESRRGKGRVRRYTGLKDRREGEK